MAMADSYIYWCASKLSEEDDIGFEDEMPVDENSEKDPAIIGKGKARESMYVSLVEEMVKTVLDGEGFLFSDEELAFFKAYSELSYKARYLLARLLVRKTGKWYRLSQLKYVSELGEDGILLAIEELCGKLGSGSKDNPPVPLRASPEFRRPLALNQFKKETIDLLSDDEIASDEVHSQERCLCTQPDEASSSQQTNQNALNYYAEDESGANLQELLKCLTVEELKTVARTLKLPNGLVTRNSYVEAILASSCVQTTLGGFASRTSSPAPKKNGRDSRSLQLKQTFLSFKPVKEVKVQTDILRGLIMKILSKCVRINDAINALFHRLHIIYFRSTEHPTSLLTPALLKRCRKRYYPLYEYVRTCDIFRSREDLMAYEDALRMEAAVDLMLEGNIDVELAEQHINAWANRNTDNATADAPPPHTLRPGVGSPEVVGSEKENAMRELSTPLRELSVGAYTKIEVDNELPPPPVKESQSVTNAKYIISVFEKVYPRWQELVQLRGRSDPRPYGLERFDEGYILTRIVYKGASAFGRLKDFDREIAILEELLAQSRWRRGKRGAWYDRWALILMHHLVREKREVEGKEVALEKEEQNRILKQALQVIVRGLEDEDTHIVSRQALEHRLFRLEKRLKIPMKDRHECQGKLLKAKETVIVGERVRTRRTTVGQDKTNRIDKPVVPVSIQIHGEEAVRRHLDQIKKDQKKAKDRWMGKSLWYGKCGEDVNVETLVLQHYELDGFKGFHSEASIISMIWGLLFWDILFSPVPGVFETPYQSAPLDIASEYFFFARRDLIKKRLQEIEDGKAPEILANTDDKYRKNNTMCVGVRWDDYSKEDLVEIVTCLGGKGLAAMCRLFCEDYGGRHSGIPDLIVWKMSDRLAKFIEVKGPGDNLSENQKVWIDVLLRADIAVEVCRVKEPDKPKTEGENVSKLPKKHRIIRVYRLDEEGNEIDIEHEEILEADDRTPRKKPKSS